jgi:hypothetical protein
VLARADDKRLALMSFASIFSVPEAEKPEAGWLDKYGVL